MFTAWDYPIVVLATFAGALTVAGWLIRAAGTRTKPAFECEVCGRLVGTYSAREWRYCPFCGVPREATELRALPRKRSILDIE
jgi:hypothetical protein